MTEELADISFRYYTVDYDLAGRQEIYYLLGRIPMTWEWFWVFLESNFFWIVPSIAVILFGVSFRRYKKPPPAEDIPPDPLELVRRIMIQMRLPGDVEIDERELLQALEALQPDLMERLTSDPADSTLAAAEAFFHQRQEQLGGLMSRSSPEAAQAARDHAILAFLRNSRDAEAAYLAAQKLDPTHPAIATQLGAAALRRGDLETAQQAYESGLALAQAIDDRQSLAISQGNLGIIHQARGNLPLAEEFHRSALAENQAIHRENGIAVQCGCLAIIFDLDGDHDRARRFRREALSVSDHAAHEQEVIELYELLARTCEERSDLEAASGYVQKALSVYEALGQMADVARQHERLGTLAQRRDEPELAREHWTQALEVFENQRDSEAAKRMQTLLQTNPPPR